MLDPAMLTRMCVEVVSLLNSFNYKLNLKSSITLHIIDLVIEHFILWPFVYSFTCCIPRNLPEVDMNNNLSSATHCHSFLSTEKIPTIQK